MWAHVWFRGGAHFYLGVGFSLGLRVAHIWAGRGWVLGLGAQVFVLLCEGGLRFGFGGVLMLFLGGVLD